jgi:hypothetical protein
MNPFRLLLVSSRPTYDQNMSPKSSEHFGYLPRQLFFFNYKTIHLGDIRVLKAIDIPHLHHLHDCVVFPCNGKNKKF